MKVSALVVLAFLTVAKDCLGNGQYKGVDTSISRMRARGEKEKNSRFEEITAEADRVALIEVTYKNNNWSSF